MPDVLLCRSLDANRSKGDGAAAVLRVSATSGGPVAVSGAGAGAGAGVGVGVGVSRVSQEARVYCVRPRTPAIAVVLVSVGVVATPGGKNGLIRSR